MDLRILLWESKVPWDSLGWCSSISPWWMDSFKKFFNMSVTGIFVKYELMHPDFMAMSICYESFWMLMLTFCTLLIMDREDMFGHWHQAVASIVHITIQIFIKRNQGNAPIWMTGVRNFLHFECIFNYFLLYFSSNSR